MGWFGCYDGPPRNADAEKRWFEREFGVEFIDYQVRRARFDTGFVFYGVVEHNGKNLALVILMQRERGEFVYKEMTETMGPAEARCPARLLALLPAPENQWAAEWRERCAVAV